MSDGLTFPRALVLEVWLDLARRFDPEPTWLWGGGPDSRPVHCPHGRAERVCAVGGFRRGKSEMKDLEILYVPRWSEGVDEGDLFGGQVRMNLTERLIEELEGLGVIGRRLDKNGRESWGPWNKHAVHVASGVPLDLFAAVREAYWNRMVVTTGPAELNVKIATAAHRKGYEWEVNSPGFVPRGGSWEACPSKRVVMESERAVFEFVGLPYVRAEDRSALVS